MVSIPIMSSPAAKVEFDRLLISASVKHEESRKDFWPFDTLSRLMTRQRIEACLTQAYREDAAEYANRIGPLYTEDSQISTKGLFLQLPKNRTYLKIFALLVIVDRERDIKLFLEDEVCDRDLPLQLCRGEGPRFHVCRGDMSRNR
ncbi:hypothetical protein F4803DRAFT_534727 [Xylaria telfairii]|nr:hypothetical protein F4803DRAFT_534727 [Xylaria telfairii]